jgi:leucine dehydrogenase
MITKNLKRLKEYDDHVALHDLSKFDRSLRGFIAIHRGSNGQPAFGATRLWNYRSEKDALRDALRLSRGMSYKAALAGLPYGGAKGTIITDPKSNTERREILKRYAQVVNKLKGNFITGTDVGLTNEDIALVKLESPFFVGVNVNPAYYTVEGLYTAIKHSVRQRFGSNTLTRRTFAIQGVGKIGCGILEKLYKQAKKIYIADINQNTVDLIAKRFKKVVVVSPKEILFQNVDVLCPCALGNVITGTVADQLNAKVVVGGANNQLQNAAAGDYLYDNGILYAPDFVANAGGLISVVNEYNNQYNAASLSRKVEQIGPRLDYILDKGNQTDTPPHRVASEIARDIFNTIL